MNLSAEDLDSLLSNNLNRWRLILGKYSHKHLEFAPTQAESLIGAGESLTDQERLKKAAVGEGELQKRMTAGATKKRKGPGKGSGSIPGGGIPHLERMDETLSWLYHREYERIDEPDRQPKSAGHSSQGLSVPTWIANVKELFPEDATKILQNDAIHRYKIAQLVVDPDILEQIEPDFDLLKAILEFKGLMKPNVLQRAKAIIKVVANQLAEKIFLEVQPSLHGTLHKHEHSLYKRFSATDWKRTIEYNLRNFDKENNRLVVERVFFWERQNRLRHHIILVIDQSGSMTNSVIYSAVMAGIFKELPNVDVSLIMFDTRIVNLTDQVEEDVVEVLLRVELGGGTDIARAVAYSSKLVESPKRTLFILITDFYEGGNKYHLLQTIKELQASGTKMIGLAALDYENRADYDHELARRVEEAGMKVAILSPKELADWVAENMGM